MSNDRLSFSGLTEAAPAQGSVRPFVLKRGDTSPAIARLLQDAFGKPISLELVSQVRFRLITQDNQTTVVDAEAVVIDAPTGRVRYQWQDGDTEQAGNYLAEWAIHFNDGRIETVPKLPIQDPVRISV